MPDIQSISALRQKDTLDKISYSKEPLYVTKNGKAYLVLLSPAFYDDIIKERDHYKKAFEKEKELSELVLKIGKSRKSIKEGKSYSEEDFDRMMDNIFL